VNFRQAGKKEDAENSVGRFRGHCQFSLLDADCAKSMAFFEGIDIDKPSSDGLSLGVGAAASRGACRGGTVVFGVGVPVAIAGMIPMLILSLINR
jgi:hypothetical protein